MKRILIAVTILALALFGCTAEANEETTDTQSFDSVQDTENKAKIQCSFVDGLPTFQIKWPEGYEKPTQAESEPVSDEVLDETEYVDEYVYEEWYSGSPSFTGDGFMQIGRRPYNGREETWYSSNVAYHYRTNEWTVDDEGYYRDDAGRYVVAVSSEEINPATNEFYTYGDTIETSKGEGIVLDNGCKPGITDFYVAF